MTSLDEHIANLAMIKLISEEPDEMLKEKIMKGLVPAEYCDVLFMELEECGRLRETLRQAGHKRIYEKPKIGRARLNKNHTYEIMFSR